MSLHGSAIIDGTRVEFCACAHLSERVEANFTVSLLSARGTLTRDKNEQREIERSCQWAEQCRGVRLTCRTHVLLAEIEPVELEFTALFTYAPLPPVVDDDVHCCEPCALHARVGWIEQRKQSAVWGEVARSSWHHAP